MPKVSVIIPVYNEARDIGECLDSLKKQTFRDFEIIVIDDGSTDDTLKVIKKISGLRVINGQHKGPGFSRNLGAKLAKGKILVFVDADMTFDKDYLKNLIIPLQEDPKVIGTTHDYEFVKNISNIWSKCWGTVRVSKEQAKDVKIFRAIRKNKFIEFGGFDPRYGYADDQTFWFKYKIKPEVANNTTCYHKNPETLIAVYKQSKWIGASIDHRVTKINFINYFLPIFMYLFSPIAIIFLAIKKIRSIHEINLFPAMLVFMIFRYFGTISGILRIKYFKINYR